MTTEDIRNLLTTVPSEAIEKLVQFLRDGHGDSFATLSETAHMLRDTDSAREVLVDSYALEISAFLAGFIAARPEFSRAIARYTVKKNTYGEFVVRFFNGADRLLPNATYFADDLADAYDTAFAIAGFEDIAERHKNKVAKLRAERETRN